MLTGESVPVSRTRGDKVLGGTINVTARVLVRATAVGRDTALAQIVGLVESAQLSKAPIQKFADYVSRSLDASGIRQWNLELGGGERKEAPSPEGALNTLKFTQQGEEE